MSHVDEGELTAYADGAYSADGTDAQRIEAHLALCANCRNRLDQARALTGRAAEILAVAAPIDIEMPDFADVRTAAAAVRRHRNAMPLTWAATVILALGLGWFGRGAVLEPELQRAVFQSATRPEAAADMTAAAPPPPAPVPELRQADATGAAARRTAPVAPIERDEVQAANALDRATTVAAAAEAPPPAAVAEKTVTQESRALVGQAAGGVADSNVDYMTPAEAERRQITLHIVPELEVLRVGVRAGEVLVEQRLPDGKLIAISAFETRDEAADISAKRETALAPAARLRSDMARNVAIPIVELNRDGLRLRVSGPLPQDSLRALAARIR